MARMKGEAEWPRVTRLSTMSWMRNTNGMEGRGTQDGMTLAQCLVGEVGAEGVML
jgi:hypothetical protein